MSEETLLKARDLMQRALDLLDRTGSAHDVGAHLDLAIARLSEMLGEGRDGFGNDNFMIDVLGQPSAEASDSLK